MFHLTDGAAWIFHDSSLLLFPGTSHLMVEESQSVRERVHMAQEEEEKSPKSHFAMAGIRTHYLSLLSQVPYPLDHGTLPMHIL